LNEYPDPKKTPEYAEKFKAFLRERVSLEQALSELTIRISQSFSSPYIILFRKQQPNHYRQISS